MAGSVEFDATKSWQLTLDVYVDNAGAVSARVSDSRMSLGRSPFRPDAIADLVEKAAEHVRTEATALQHSLKTTGKAPGRAS